MSSLQLYIFTLSVPTYKCIVVHLNWYEIYHLQKTNNNPMAAYLLVVVSDVQYSAHVFDLTNLAIFLPLIKVT